MSKKLLISLLFVSVSGLWCAENYTMKVKSHTGAGKQSKSKNQLPDILETLIEQHKQQIAEKNQELEYLNIKLKACEYSLGDTPLYKAVKNNDIEGAKLLLESPTKKNTPLNINDGRKTRDESITPLMAATQKNNEAMVALLLENEANPNIGHNTNLYYTTPLATAAELGHQGIVELLLKHYADPDKGEGHTLNNKTSPGQNTTSPYQIAHGEGYEEIMKMLKARNANTSIKKYDSLNDENSDSSDDENMELEEKGNFSYFN